MQDPKVAEYERSLVEAGFDLREVQKLIRMFPSFSSSDRYQTMAEETYRAVVTHLLKHGVPIDRTTVPIFAGIMTGAGKPPGDKENAFIRKTLTLEGLDASEIENLIWMIPDVISTDHFRDLAESVNRSIVAYLLDLGLSPNMAPIFAGSLIERGRTMISDQAPILN